MKSEQRWQKVGLVSITFRKEWPSAAAPGHLAPARSGPDPGPDPDPDSGRARPPRSRSGLEAGLPARGEPPPSQARAPDSPAAAISEPGGADPRCGPGRPWSRRRPRGPVRQASDCARRLCAGAHSGTESVRRRAGQDAGPSGVRPGGGAGIRGGARGDRLGAGLTP